MENTSAKFAYFADRTSDDEHGLHQDYEQWLEALAPHEPVSHYRHNRTGEDNGDACHPGIALSHAGGEQRLRI